MKRCPYCVKRLPFSSTVWQRLTAGEEGSLKCNNCSSTISNVGAATLWPDAALGSICGFVLSEVFRDYSIKTTAICIFAGLIIFIVSSYFTAPIRDA